MLPRLRVALERAARRSVDLLLLNSAPPLVRLEIARTGRVLLQRDRRDWIDFRAHAMIDCWDWRQPRGSCTTRWPDGCPPRPDVVSREIAAAKTGRARAWLNDAASRIVAPIDAFVADPKGRDLALFYLFLAIQAMNPPSAILLLQYTEC